MRANSVENKSTPPVLEMARALDSMTRSLASDAASAPAEGCHATIDQHVAKAVRRCVEGPEVDLTWEEIGLAGKYEPDACLAGWSRVSQAAIADEESGNRAARELRYFDSTPYERAVFLNIRKTLIEEWQPSSGSELQIIDMIAQTRMILGRWTQRHTESLILGMARDRENGTLFPPRVFEAEALEQTAHMMERFQRMYIRLVRTLKELKKAGSPVVVQNASQVNVGNQQVNVSSRAEA